MATFANIRQQLVAALELDLIGASSDRGARRHEQLSQSPSICCKTGFLVPNSFPEEAGIPPEGDAPKHADQGGEDPSKDTTLPPDLQERIASGDLFFPTATEACNFQAQLRRYGAVKLSKKLSWRHRWSDAIREDVLARLLALNAERFAEEQAMGLHSKRGKAAAKPVNTTGTTGATRRGAPEKGSPVSQTERQLSEQMGLGL